MITLSMSFEASDFVLAHLPVFSHLIAPLEPLVPLEFARNRELHHENRPQSADRSFQLGGKVGVDYTLIVLNRMAYIDIVDGRCGTAEWDAAGNREDTGSILTVFVRIPDMGGVIIHIGWEKRIWRKELCRRRRRLDVGKEEIGAAALERWRVVGVEVGQRPLRL